MDGGATQIADAFLLQTGKQQYALDLTWLTLTGSPDLAERRAALVRDYGATHTVDLNTWYPQIGFGRIPAKHARIPAFSLAYILARRADALQFPKDWMGLFQLPNSDRYWLLSISDNCIDPDGDRVGSRDEMLARANELLAPDAGGHAPSRVVAKAEDAAELQNVQDLSEITLDALLDPGAKHPEDKQARLISINAAKKKRFKLIALVGLAILAYFTVDIGYDLYKDKKKREDLAATARAAAEAAKNALPRAAEPPAFAPVTLPLPSSQFPTATLTLVRCVNQVNELAARVGGWNLAATRCDGNTVSATYNRSENGRPVNVLHELLPGAVTNDAGTIATITYGLPAAQVRSGETLLETVEAREAFVGFFQQLHESVTLTAKPLTPGIFNSLAAVPAEKLNKEAVTIQPFAAYSFTASTARIPTRLTPAFQLPGVVIRDITTTFARDANNRFTKTYTINGDLYAL